MQVRAAREQDMPAIRHLTEAAFGQPDEADLVDRLIADNDAVISLVAEHDGTLAGHVMFSHMTAPMRALGLAPVSVLPAYQRQGVGTALIRQGLGIAAETGWQAVFVLGDPGYYTRFGFSPDAAKGFQNAFAGPHFMALALVPDALPTTGAVSYAAAFG